MKKVLLFALTGVMVFSLTGCGGGKKDSGNDKEASAGEVVVYNWGEYMDPDVLDEFEEETGIKVVYDEFETNEIMYPKVEAGAVSYDVVCPSDYMIQKMIENDLLAELNFDNIPNIKKIDEQIPATSTPCRTAGVRSASSTTRLWWTGRLRAGISCGTRNTKIIS